MQAFCLMNRCSAGGGFRTHDLQIMSIASCGEAGTLGQAELPRHEFRDVLFQIKFTALVIY